MQSSWMKYLVLILFVSTAPRAFAGTCDFLLSSSKVTAVLTSLQNEMQVAPTWQNYRLSQEPVVLAELGTNSNCAVLLLNGKIVSAFESSEKIKLANNAYAFMSEGRSNSSDELGHIPLALADVNIKEALVWNLDFAWPVHPTLQVGIMAHEGFHLFVQRDKLQTWPKWPTAQGQFSGSSIRKELVRKCYNGSSQIVSLANQEFAFLLDAYRNVVAGNLNQVRHNVSDFVKARILRYDLLKNEKVVLNGNSSMSCPEIESSFEFNEGIPDYVFYATSLNSKAVDFGSLESFLKENYLPSKGSESYYAFGGLQLLLLAVLNPNFHELQQTLLDSKNAAEGLFTQFQQQAMLSCEFESTPTVLETGDSHLLQYWEFSNSSILDLAELPTSPTFIAYKGLVSSKLNTDPVELLARYSVAGANANDQHNLEVVRKNPSKYIRPIRCLEALLLDNQIKRNKEMSVKPTEFVAFYLKNNDGRMRVYYLTDDISGVRKPSSLFERIYADMAEGWIVLGNLHNHSFFLDNLNNDEAHHPQGVLIPSANDTQVLRANRDDFKMQSVSITNGFHTIFMPSEELDSFRDPDGK